MAQAAVLNPPPYEDLSLEELRTELTRRDQRIAALQGQKLGLTWTRAGMEAEAALNAKLAVLNLRQDLSVGTPPQRNLVIEGDNYDALRALSVSHQGKVHCIYIDPPYNTGSKDFVYNDKFVEEDDPFRHSKWLSFMEARLKLADELLHPDGVMFVSIGEDEHANLELLMRQTMRGQKLGTFIVRTRTSKNAAANMFNCDHDYLICYTGASGRFVLGGDAKDLDGYTNPDGDPRGPWQAQMLSKGANLFQRPEAFYPICDPATDTWYPCSADGVWRFAQADRAGGKKLQSGTMEQQIGANKVLFRPNHVQFASEEALLEAIRQGDAPKELRIYLQLDALRDQVARGEVRPRVLEVLSEYPLSFWVGKRIGTLRPQYKRHTAELRSNRKPVSSLIFKSANDSDQQVLGDLEGDRTVLCAGTNAEGKKALNAALEGSGFTYPKPVSLIRALIEQATANCTDAIVLDFFGGSGTTAQAVLELNAQDGGDRSFILVNWSEKTHAGGEKNICRDIMAARIRNVIERVGQPGDGFAYLQVELIEWYDIERRLLAEQTWTALRLLHLQGIDAYRHDVRFQVQGSEGEQLVYVPMLGESALSDEDAAELRTLCRLDATHIYTEDPRVIQQIVGYGTPDRPIVIHPVPDAIKQRFTRLPRPGRR